ncbi:hypothetical protein BGX27_011262 [Mortierella sp. AM989]|nr:hypothetical protein BGX27_011262 [Mortierella sp. AM989]
MSTKQCIIKGQRECVRGFHKDQCIKCTKGSAPCNMCNDSPTSSPCIYCLNGRMECDDCFGLGHVQRICRPCIDDHYRRQSNKNTVTKVKSQLVVAQSQFSKSMVSLSSAISSNIPTSGLGLLKNGHHSDTDVSNDSSSYPNHQISSKMNTIRSAAATLEKFTTKLSDKTHRRKWSWSSFNNAPSSMVAA